MLFKILKIGSSIKNKKKIKLNKKINIDEWIVYENFYPDKFNLKLVDDNLEITRIDANIGWGQDLVLLKHVKSENKRIPKTIYQTYHDKSKLPQYIVEQFKEKIINIGSSDLNNKVIVHNDGNCKLDDISLLTVSSSYSDTFTYQVKKIDKYKSKIKVTRTDIDSGWGQNLQVSYSIARDFDYYFYDDEAAINFLKNNYGDIFVKRFKNLIGAHKADLLRYCLLYKNGGYYFDIKQILQKDISKIFHSQNDKVWYTVIGLDKKHIHQATIATPPRNPILLRCLYHMLIGNNSDYMFTTKQMYKFIYNECNNKNLNGINKLHEGWSCYLFQEIDSINDYPKDKYNNYSKIMDGDKYIIYGRDYNFPY